MTLPVNHWAVIPAAGIGARMEAEYPKQYLKIHDKYILEHTIERFSAHPRITGVVVALAKNDPYWAELSLSNNEKVKTTIGGKERYHSVLNCLNYLQSFADQEDWVLVHDAARPCVRREDIDNLMAGLEQHPVGGILALPVKDTMKRAGDNNQINETVERQGLWHALTPQMFRLGQLRRALSEVLERGLLVTDDAQAIEALGLQPALVQGHPDNIKITLQSDLTLAEFFISQQEESH